MYIYIYISIYLYTYTCLYNLDLIFYIFLGHLNYMYINMGMSLVSDIILYFVELPSATEITSAHLQTDNKANLWQCFGEPMSGGSKAMDPQSSPWVDLWPKSWSNDLEENWGTSIFFEPSIYLKVFSKAQRVPRGKFSEQNTLGVKQSWLVASNLFIFHGYPERRCRKTCRWEPRLDESWRPGPKICLPQLWNTRGGSEGAMLVMGGPKSIPIGWGLSRASSSHDFRRLQCMILWLLCNTVVDREFTDRKLACTCDVWRQLRIFTRRTSALTSRKKLTRSWLLGY